MTETEELQENIDLLGARRTSLRAQYDRYDLLFWQYPEGSPAALECEGWCDKLAERIDRLSDQIARLNNELWENNDSRWALAVARRELPL